MLLKIQARHPESLKQVFLYYKSIKQAKYFNKYLVDFEIIGKANS